MENSNPKERLIGIYAGLLATAEIGIGSLMHAFHLPFSGYILSLNQVLLLTKASDEEEAKDNRNLTASISNIAAILKSLSPMGKRVTPMIAIAMQGLLYNVGILIGGNRMLGRGIGGCLLAVWGFIQPLLLYYLIFGQVLFEAIYEYIPEGWFWTFLMIIVGIKCLLAFSIARLAPWIPSRWWERWLPKDEVKEVDIQEHGWKEAAWKALKDMTMIPFIISIFLTATFLYAYHGNVDAVVWGVLRPIAIGYLVFFSLRILPVSKIADWLERNPQLPLSRAFHIALMKTRNYL